MCPSFPRKCILCFQNGMFSKNLPIWKLCWKHKQKGKSIFLQPFDISQQIAISSLQGYFSAAAAENIESQDGLSFGIFKKLKICIAQVNKEQGMVCEHVINCRCWVQNLLSDGWSSLEQYKCIRTMRNIGWKEMFLLKELCSSVSYLIP